MAGRTPLNVVLYTREGCHLCDQAEQMLTRIGERIPMQVHLIDIDSDDYLQRLYMVEIPVVAVDGMEIARAPIFEGKLEDALAALL